MEGWKTQAEPVAEIPEEESPRVPETQQVPEPPTSVEDPLAKIKAEVSARAETLREIKERDKKFETYKKSLSKIEKKALDQIRKDEENRQKREARVLRGRLQSNLSGCENPEDVWVNEDFASNRTWRVNAKVMVRNISSVPVDISVGGIPAVRNLCPGGSLVLTRKLNTWQDGNFPNIIFSAEGTLDDGRIATSQKRVNLNIWQAQWQISRQDIWNICLQGSRCRN